MRRIFGICRNMAVVLLVSGFVALVGCEGTETREHVDDTVEEFAGKKNVDRMKQMKKDIGKVEESQARKYDRVDEAGDDR